MKSIASRILTPMTIDDDDDLGRLTSSSPVYRLYRKPALKIHGSMTSQRLIPKPPRLPNCGLRRALALHHGTDELISKELYLRIKDAVLKSLESHPKIDRKIPLSKQPDRRQINMVLRQMAEAEPYLKKFENNWAAKEFLRRSLGSLNRSGIQYHSSARTEKRAIQNPTMHAESTLESNGSNGLNHNVPGPELSLENRQENTQVGRLIVKKVIPVLPQNLNVSVEGSLVYPPAVTSWPATAQMSQTYLPVSGGSHDITPGRYNWLQFEFPCENGDEVEIDIKINRVKKYHLENTIM